MTALHAAARNPSAALATVHGFAGTPATFSGLGLRPAYEHWVAGHGPDANLVPQTFEEEVDRLADKLRQLPQPVHLVGYSLGARLALATALRRPETVGLCTVFGPNPGLETDDAREDRLAWESRWVDVLEQDGIAVFEHKWRNLPLFDSQASLPPGVLEKQRLGRLCHSARGLAYALCTLGLGAMPNYWPLLGELRVPVIWAVGSQDQKFLEFSKRAALLSPLITSVVIEGVGHNPVLEAPHLVRELLLRAETNALAKKPSLATPEPSHD